MGHAQQLHVGEHHARALFTVVKQHVHAGGFQFGVELLGQLGHAHWLVHVHRHDGHFERGDGVRPDDAVLVVVLLDGGGHQTGDSDAVATHLHGDGLAALVQHARLHGFGVLGAELEDVAHFDAALEQQLALAARARVAFHHVAQVGNLVGGDVAIPVGPGQVEAGLVGATDEVR